MPFSYSNMTFTPPFKSSFGNAWLSFENPEPVLEERTTSLPAPFPLQKGPIVIPKPNTKSPKEIWDEFLAKVEKNNGADAATVSETLRLIALGPSIGQLVFLRPYLFEKNLYSYEVYLSELIVLRGLRKSQLALALFDWRRELLTEPVSQIELLDIISSHKGQDKHALADLLHFTHRLCSEGYRNRLGTTGFNTILQVVIGTPSVAIGDHNLLQIFEEMTKESPNLANTATYVLVMRGMRDLKYSADWFDRARSDGFQTVSLNEVYIQRLISRGNVTEAFEIYRELVALGDSKMVSTGLLATVLEHCTTTGDLAGTREVFDGSTALGINPTTKMFALLIDLCAVVKDVEMANTIISRDLPRYGLETDRLIYNSLISLYCAVDDMVHAEGVVQEMRQRRPSDVQENTITPIFLKCLALYRTSGARPHHQKAMHYWRQLAKSNHRVPIEVVVEAVVRLGSQYIPKIIRDAPKMMHSRESMEHLWRMIMRCDDVRPEYFLQIFAALTRIPRFHVAPAHFSFLIKQMASDGNLKVVFELAFDVIEIWNRRHQITLYPPQKLQTVSHSIFHFQGPPLPFEITSTFAKDFLEDVVFPNRLEHVEMPLPNDDTIIWTDEHVYAWFRALRRWNQDCITEGLIENCTI